MDELGRFLNYAMEFLHFEHDDRAGLIDALEFNEIISISEACRDLLSENFLMLQQREQQQAITKECRNEFWELVYRIRYG